MTTKPTKPADLDNSKLHTREQYRQWQADTYDYFAAVKAEEQQERMKQQAKAEAANRPLTEDEYYAAAVQRKAAQDARDAERDAEKKAKEEAKQAYLESMPEVAEIDASNPYSFLTQVCHWSAKGYTLSETAEITFLPTFYAAKLNKPATVKTKE